MNRTRDEEIKRALKINRIGDEPKEDGHADDTNSEKDPEEFVIHRPVSNNIVKMRRDEIDPSIDPLDSALLSLEF